MAKQLTFTAYTFDELSDRAKDKARQWMRECIDVDDWSEQTIEDAAQVGLKITGFDVGRASECNIDFSWSRDAVAEAILKEHGETCGTYKAATEYLEAISKLPDDTSAEDNSEARIELEERAIDAFRKALETDYLKDLRAAYQYSYSDEAIDETIEANDYLFAEDGSRTVTLNA